MFSILVRAHVRQPALDKESRWSDTPWQPGQIPTRQGTLRSIHGRLDQQPAPYGEFMGVEAKPSGSGSGLPKKED